MRVREFAAGEMVFLEGDPSNAAYIIKSGRVEILKESPGGPLRLAVLGEGDIFGEMGLVDERPRSAAARALEPVVATAVDRHELLELLLHRPREALALLRVLFERLRMADQALAARIAADRPPPTAAGPQRITLRPLTPETRAVLPSAGVAVTRIPFRVGRKPSAGESELLAMNEIEFDSQPPHQLSLNHFALDLDHGQVIVRDRGSRDGTIVNGGVIGGAALRDTAALMPGENEVIAGKADSPYRLAVIVSDG
jgi:CRP-like cAMP-binding protein